WLVLGGEIDFNWMRAALIGRSEPFWLNDDPNFATVASNAPWLATARVRAGVLMTPSLLLYATGGLAVTRVQDTFGYDYPTYPTAPRWSETRTLYGVAFGGGFEYALTPHWSVKGEYLRAVFDEL